MFEISSPVRAVHERNTLRIPVAGEMADRIRAFAWNSTPLGPIDLWPESLLCSLNLMLACRLPSLMFYGRHKIQFYNDAAIPVLAQRHPIDLGVPAHQSWAEAWDLIGPQIESVYEGQSVFQQNVLVPVQRDGRLQEIFWTYSYSPIYDAQSNVVGLINFFQDETRELLAERKRDAATRQLNHVLEVTTDSIIALDHDWHITYMNPRAAQELAPMGEVLNRICWEAFPATAYEGSPYLEHYHRAMDERIASEFEAYYPEPLNIWAHIQARPSDDGIILFYRDITTQKQSTAALIEAEKLASVGRLAASIAHEINNPLESVTNLLYLARTSQDLAEIDGYLDSAEGELRRVSVISNQTLRFHKQSSIPKPVTSQELFSSVLAIFQGRLAHSAISVEKDHLSPAPILCFEGEIRQVLNNLTGNAIDAMHPEGGRLILRSREATCWSTDERGLLLTLADTGPGISQAILKQIFRAFFTTKGAGGTGLGLWVSQEIVDRHHGTLRVRSSQAPSHHGTVFLLFLPFEAVVRSEPTKSDSNAVQVP